MKKKLQIQGNYYLEILDVLQKLERNGNLNFLINFFQKVHQDEQNNILQGL